MMDNFRYDVIKNDEMIGSYDDACAATEYAESHDCQYVVKFDTEQFIPVNIIWEKKEE